MYVRLHDAGFHQSSQYRRNVMIQPGPLTIKPSERSLAEPSFRLIDFGKGGRLQKKSHRSYFKDLDDWTGYQLYRRNELLDNLQDRFEVIIRKPGDTVVQEWNPQVGPMTNRSMRQIY